MRAAEDVGALRHEVHAAEDDDLRLRTRGGLPGQLEGVTAEIRELDDVVALVVVPQDDQPLAEAAARASFSESPVKSANLMTSSRW